MPSMPAWTRPPTVAVAFLLMAMPARVRADEPPVHDTSAAPTPARANQQLVTQPALRAGMPAPALHVDAFLKGSPITVFEKDRVYVIELWATWCGPCIAAIPHLSALQREYQDKGVTICAVNILEPQKPGTNTLDTIRSFVEKRGDAISYTVAFDGQPDKSVREWLHAAGRESIPCCFVINRAGKIAWIGNPMSLPVVLDEVVRDTWDITAGPARLKDAIASFQAALAKYNVSLAAGDSAWSELERSNPSLVRTRRGLRLSAMFRAGYVDAASELANQSLDVALLNKDSGSITAVLESLEGATLQHDTARTLLLKAAQANFTLADATQPGPHIVLARAYFYGKQLDKARAAANRALELTPESTRAATAKWLDEMEKEAAAASQTVK